MLQMESKLRACDNSGAKLIKCIHFFGGFDKKFGKEGDLMLVSVRSIRFMRKVKKGQKCLALIIRTKKKRVFKDGSSSFFGSNGAVLLNSKKRLLGSKIKGPVSKYLRKLKYMKILQLTGYLYF